MIVMKKIILLLLFIQGALMSQVGTTNFYNDYSLYKDNIISERRFGHEVITQLVEKLKKNPKFTVEVKGYSLNGDPIYLISTGSGSTRVLSWSQMHGDESTATMALVDLFNFLAADDNYNDFRKNLLENVTLYFVPMLNPDGAGMFQRRNALDIDLNRDAARQQMPESKVLVALQDSIKPEFGFNLHDQSTYYTAGRSKSSAMLSFLAPAYNYAKDMNAVREKTMQVIGHIYNQLSPFIPGHIGRYDDEYEPRAFGEFMMRNGTASTLVESGGWKNDSEKQFIRKMNFVTLLTAYEVIASGGYQKVSTDVYWSIPENERNLFDLMLRNVNIEYKGKSYIIDLGIKREEENTPDFKDKYYSGKIEDIGDLSVFAGYEEINCSGLVVKEGKTYPESFKNFADLKKLDYIALLREGYTSVLCEELPKEKFSKLPLNVLAKRSDKKEGIKTGDPANLILYRNDKLVYVVVNGFLFDLNTNKLNIYNTINFEK